MKFSLITVSERHSDGTVSGNWVQNHVGTLETATEKAVRTEEVNSNRIDVAVIEELPSPVPMLDYHSRHKRLDTPRPQFAVCQPVNAASYADRHQRWSEEGKA